MYFFVCVTVCAYKPCSNMHLRIRTHTHTHTCIHTCTHTHTHTRIPHTYIPIWVEEFAVKLLFCKWEHISRTQRSRTKKPNELEGGKNQKPGGGGGVAEAQRVFVARQNMAPVLPKKTKKTCWISWKFIKLTWTKQIQEICCSSQNKESKKKGRCTRACQEQGEETQKRSEYEHRNMYANSTMNSLNSLGVW